VVNNASLMPLGGCRLFNMATYMPDGSAATENATILFCLLNCGSNGNDGKNLIAASVMLGISAIYDGIECG
jgi:hypothetical protein